MAYIFWICVVNLCSKWGMFHGEKFYALIAYNYIRIPAEKFCGIVFTQFKVLLYSHSNQCKTFAIYCHTIRKKHKTFPWNILYLQQLHVHVATQCSCLNAMHILNPCYYTIKGAWAVNLTYRQNMLDCCSFSLYLTYNTLSLQGLVTQLWELQLSACNCMYIYA